MSLFVDVVFVVCYVRRPTNAFEFSCYCFSFLLVCVCGCVHTIICFIQIHVEKLFIVYVPGMG